MIGRKTFTIVALVAISSLTIAGTPKKYGKDITLKDKTPVSDILSNPEKYDGKRVLVEGPVVDVCKKRGCWIKVGSNEEFGSIRFKVEDGVIVFPLSAKGKSAIAEGLVSVRTLSKEELIKQGEEHAKEEGTKFDPSTVTGPKKIIQIMGEGAVIR